MKIGRKIGSFCMALLLLTGAGLSLPAQSAESETYLWPRGIGAGGSTEAYITRKGEHAEATREEVHSGNYAVKVWNKNTNRTRIWAEAEGLTTGRTYTATVFVKFAAGTFTQNRGVYLYAMADHTKGASLSIKSKFCKSAADWTQLSVTFTLPENSGRVTLCMDAQPIENGYAVYWDDLTLSGYSGDLNGGFETVDEWEYIREDETVMPEDGESILPNGNFESDCKTAGTASRWTAYKGWSDSNSFVTISDSVFRAEDTGLSTGHSLRLSAKEADGDANPWCSKMLSVTPLTEYVVSAYVRADALVGDARARIKFECYTEPRGSSAKAGADFNSEEIGAVTNGEWVQLIQTFYTRENCYGVAVMPRLYGAGEVYFDDIAVKQKSARAQFHFSTDGVYYYTDMSRGVATATALRDLSYAGKTVSFSLSANGEIVQKAENVPFTDGKAEFTYSLTALRKNTPYTLTAVLLSGTAEVDRQETEIYRMERPAYLRKDGVYLKNRETPFYPVIAYHVSREDYGKMPEAGINVVQATFTDYTALRNSLDAAEKEGIMVLAALYSGMEMPTSPGKYDISYEAITRLRKHPALYGWMVMDEPFANYPHHEAEKGLREAYLFIRSLDPDHPVYVLDNQAITFSVTAKYADILATDPYTAAKHDRANYVYNQMAAAKEAAGDKPTYAILQAFRYSGVFPTGAELRSAIYQAFMADASAVGYYAIGDADGALELYDTPLWESMCSYVEPDFKVLYEGTGGETESGTGYRMKPYTLNGVTYLAVQNTKSTAADVGYTYAETVAALPAMGASEGECIHTGTVYTADEGALSVPLQACGTGLYALYTGEEEAAVLCRQNGKLTFSPGTGSMELEFRYKNSGTQQEEYAFYLATYADGEKGKELIDLASTKHTVASGETVRERFPAECGSGQTVCAMFWKAGLVPQMKTFYNGGL
ncbi:MAG: carbohydrate binding domain-containing protein [Clostridia bacterium]|nr:carbohydrate binding domain-containing protein [Clostridia bacterium]